MNYIPTISLQKLFEDLDFLSQGLPGQKPCFRRRYYVDKTSWVGTFCRMVDQESQATLGNILISNICKSACEHYESYKNHPYFKEILMDKIIRARQGLARIAETYDSVGQFTTATNIRNSGILMLDGVIPKDKKIQIGIELAPPTPLPLPSSHSTTPPIPIFPERETSPNRGFFG